MAINKFVPNNKGKFSTTGGKRIFPPEWYAAQAARRKKNSDGTYKKGQFKTSTVDNDKPKTPKNFPKEWKENQRRRAEERKASGEERKVRGKRSEYKDKGIDSSLKGKREVIASETDAGIIYNQLYRGDKAKIRVKDAHEVVSILGFGVTPGTKKGVNKKGQIYTVDSNNLVSAWL